MHLKVICPNCSKRFRTLAENLGRTTNCPVCAHALVIQQTGTGETENVHFDEKRVNSAGHHEDLGAMEFAQSFARLSKPELAPSRPSQYRPPAEQPVNLRPQARFVQRLGSGAVIGIAAGISLAVCGYLLVVATLYSGKSQHVAERQALRKNPIREEFMGVTAWSDGETMWTEFRGKRIPKDHALILGLLQPEKSVEVYEDPKSLPFKYVIRDRETGFVFTERWEDAKYQQARKDGWISELQPMLLVRVVEKIHGDQFAWKYWYKDRGVIVDTLVKVQVAEGPRMGDTWWIRGIDLVEFAQPVEDVEASRKYSKASPEDAKPAKEFDDLFNQR